MSLGHGATVPKLVMEAPKQELEPSNKKLPTVDYLAVDMLLNQRIVTNNRANEIVNGHPLLNGLHAANLVEQENKLDREYNFKLQLTVDRIAKVWELNKEIATHSPAQSVANGAHFLLGHPAAKNVEEDIK